MFYRILFALLIFKTHQVNMMSLNGTSLSHYVPCGLGIISMENNGTIWKAVVDLELYPKVLEELHIVFEVPVALVSVSFIHFGN